MKSEDITLEYVEETYNNKTWCWNKKPIMCALVFICKVLTDIKKLLEKKSKGDQQ